MNGATVKLRPLALGDFKMLLRWHLAPHVRAACPQAPGSLRQIEHIFAPRLDPTHTVRCRIAVMDGMPYGFAQWYPSRADPHSAAMQAGLAETCTADYFIGNAAFLGLGLGVRLLEALKAEVFAALPATTLCIAHDDHNQAATATVAAAGFAPLPRPDDRATSTIYVVQA